MRTKITTPAAKLARKGKAPKQALTAGQKAAATRRANLAAAKNVASLLAWGARKTAAGQKAVATKRAAGILQLAGQKAAATRRANLEAARALLEELHLEPLEQ